MAAVESLLETAKTRNIPELIASGKRWAKDVKDSSGTSLDDPSEKLLNSW